MKNVFKKIRKNVRTSVKRFNKNVEYNYNAFSKRLAYLKLMHWTYPKKIFLGILIIFIVGACLLYSPISFNYTSYEYVNNEFIFTIDTSNTNEYFGITEKTIKYNFLDALFMASSAFTDSGFSLINLGMDLSIFGQLVIFSLIQIGGFGYISLFYLLGRALRTITKKNIFSTSLLSIERGGTKVSNSSNMIVRIFLIILIIQFIFSLAMSGILYSYPFMKQQNWSSIVSSLPYGTDFTININGVPFKFNSDDKNINNLLSISFDNIYGEVHNTYHNYGTSLWYAIFLCGSAINNAGFDLFGSSSLEIFRNDMGILVQCLILILVVIGGIGFPVIYDISLYFDWFVKHKIKYKLLKKVEYQHIEKPRLNNFSKICIYSWIVITLLSIAILYSVEYAARKEFEGLGVSDIQNYFSLMNFPNYVQYTDQAGELIRINFFGENADLNKNFSIIFTAISARSAGFATINMITFSEPSILIIGILMFIGTSPSSTGGGIRTTTLAIVVKSLFSKFRGLEKTSFMKRKVPSYTVANSYTVLIISIILIVFMTLIFYITSEISIGGKNLVTEEYKNKSVLYSFSYFFFECSSAFSTSGLTIGVTNSEYIQAWNLIMLIILMYIGQLGVSSTLLIFARKTPKKTESSYLDMDIRIG